MTISTLPGLYRRVRRTRPCDLRIPLMICGLTATAALMLCQQCGFRFNSTASLPIGLYVVSKSATANLVAFCPPDPFSSLSAMRGYRNAGNCPDGNSPLLKPVIAKPGDVVIASARGLAVNGKLLLNTTPRERDSKGRPLPHVPFGSYVVSPGSVWVASTYHPLSFDSRYFGPIASTSIREHLKPVFVF